jgi:hypothetical protein
MPPQPAQHSGRRRERLGEAGGSRAQRPLTANQAPDAEVTNTIGAMRGSGSVSRASISTVPSGVAATGPLSTDSPPSGAAGVTQFTAPRNSETGSLPRIGGGTGSRRANTSPRTAPAGPSSARNSPRPRSSSHGSPPPLSAANRMRRADQRRGHCGHRAELQDRTATVTALVSAPVSASTRLRLIVPPGGRLTCRELRVERHRGFALHLDARRRWRRGRRRHGCGGHGVPPRERAGGRRTLSRAAASRPLGLRAQGSRKGRAIGVLPLLASAAARRGKRAYVDALAAAPTRSSR